MKNFLLLSLTLFISILTNINIAQAQTYQPSNRSPVADNTLGTQVLRNNNNFSITGGITRGQNTFHSFQDFSVPTNGVATFANPAGNQSIITRVTGGLFSDINGTINTQGANFLLINPNGVVFGPGTQLNVGRVFAASTANGIDLADGAGRTLTFGVNGSGDGALLSIDPKVIFNVSRLNLGGGTGEINNFGTLRINNPGQYIGLVGGNVALNGGGIFSQAGGRVELGGLSAPGSVGVGIEGTNLRLSYPQDVARANVSLNNKAVINTVGNAGADISIKAKNIEVLGGSNIINGILSGNGTAGDVKLQATENINISGANTLVGNAVVLSGKGGNILVDADSVTVQDNAAIGTNTFGKGSLGNITVTAKNAVSLTGKSTIASLVSSGAEGNGGDISITANSVSIQDNARLNAFSQGKGNNGNITITAQDTADIKNSSVFSSIEVDRAGNTGNVTITAGKLLLGDSDISTSNFGQGNTGDLTLKVKDSATINNSSIINNIQGTGKGGGVSIESADLSINSSIMSASVFGQGNAGNISLKAENGIVIKGTDTPTLIASIIGEGAIGKGGNITFDSGSLSFSNARLRTLTSGIGNAGDITLNAKDAIFMTGKSSITSAVQETGIGNSGNIKIKSTSLSIDNSSLANFTDGQGSAGNTNIFSDGRVYFANARILSDVGAGAIGNGSNINIQAGSLSLDKNSSLSTSIYGNGRAGDIIVSTQNAVSLVDTSNFITNVGRTGIGNSGAINIDAKSLALDNSSILSFTAGQGDTGNTNITTQDTFSLVAGSRIDNNVFSSGIGKGGNINIKSGSLLGDYSIINSSTSGMGDAGNVSIAVRDNFSFSRALVYGDVSPGAVGKGGNINVSAGSLSFTIGSQLISAVRAGADTRSAGRGDAGNITVKVAGDAKFDTSTDLGFSGLFSTTEVGTIGNGGNISITAKNISFREGAAFRTTTAGIGNSGSVTLTAADQLSFDGSAGILTRVDASGIGNGGNINVSSRDISFRNGAGLSADTLGQGRAGNIVVDATNSIFLSGEGNNTRSLFVIDRGGIFTRSQSATGIAGDITVTAPKIMLDNGGIITAQSDFGGGGNITIGSKNATDLFFLRRGSQVATDAGVTAKQGGDGGNININANFIFAVPKENSDISANAAQGRGGNVNVNSQGLFGIQQRSQPSSNSDITASSSFGQNGILNINTLGIDPGKDTSDLPSTPTDASRQITQTCNSSQVGDRFFVTGRGGHPATSEESLTQEVVWLDPRNPRTAPTIAKISTSSTQSLQPAVGWAFNGKGKVTLLANGTNEIKRANVICPNSSH